MKAIGIVAGIALALFSPAAARPQASADREAERVVKRIDDLYRSSSSEALMEMQIVTPHWQRTLRIRAWSLGMDKTFLRILEPRKEAGIATLRIGNEMWNFLPDIDKVIKVPPSMMMSAWMGSDLTNDDLVKEFTFLDSYHFTLVSVDTPEPDLIYVQCIPKEGLPIVWGKVILAARRADSLPVWETYYDDRGNLVREMKFRDVRAFGNRRIPSVMELVPKTKKGQKTVLRYVEAKFDTPLSPEIFTLRNLHGGI
jgi:outer membrane lipoprotein-sorting protein